MKEALGDAAGRPQAAEAPLVRPSGAGDEAAVAALIYETAPHLHDMMLGTREQSLAMLTAAFRRSGNNASAEVVHVAEIGGEVAAAIACFPARESRARGRALMRLVLSRSPFWHWPREVGFYWRGGRVVPSAPAESLYVDALATAEGFRRRGAAVALLELAERRAVSLGLTRVALDTELDNRRARLLYESFGFETRGQTRPRLGLPGFVSYVKTLTRPGS